MPERQKVYLSLILYLCLSVSYPGKKRDGQGKKSNSSKQIYVNMFTDCLTYRRKNKNIVRKKNIGLSKELDFIRIYIYFYTSYLYVYVHIYFSDVNPLWWIFFLFRLNFSFNRIQVESELKRTTGNYLSVCYNWIWSFDITPNTKATTIAKSNPSNTNNDDGDNSNSAYKIH